MNNDGCVSLGDILRGYLARLVAPTSERAPIDPDRIGVQREPINRLVRRAVLMRDNYRCQWCSASYQRDQTIVFEIDHIVPWSAGGSDHPVNLRTLCQDCNQLRSNRVSELDRRALPVVWRCYGCDQWGDVEHTEPLFRAYCMTCRETTDSAPYVADLMIGGPLPTKGIPALRPGDEVLPAGGPTVRPWNRRFRDLREKDDRRRNAARRAAARAELDAIRPADPDQDRPA